MRKLTLKLVAAASIGATVVAVVASLFVGPAAAATSSVSKPSTSVLVPVSAAKAAGFTKVVNAPSTSTDTGVTGCPDGAQEEFASASGNLGLVSEVLYCESAADATKLLKNLATNGKAQAGLSPPKGLGSTAVERLGSDSSYLIAWRRGTAFELTGTIHGSALEFDDKYHHGDASSAQRRTTSRCWQTQRHNRARDSRM